MPAEIKLQVFYLLACQQLNRLRRVFCQIKSAAGAAAEKKKNPAARRGKKSVGEYQAVALCDKTKLYCGVKL